MIYWRNNFFHFRLTTFPFPTVLYWKGKLFERLEYIKELYSQYLAKNISHICISFAACKVYKELERLLKEKNAGYSAEQAIEIIKTIYKVKIQTPYLEQIYERLIIKNDDQKAIVDLFDLDLNWENLSRVSHCTKQESMGQNFFNFKKPHFITQIQSCHFLIIIPAIFLLIIKP